MWWNGTTLSIRWYSLNHSRMEDRACETTRSAGSWGIISEIEGGKSPRYHASIFCTRVRASHRGNHGGWHKTGRISGSEISIIAIFSWRFPSSDLICEWRVESRSRVSSWTDHNACPREVVKTRVMPRVSLTFSPSTHNRSLELSNFLTTAQWNFVGRASQET